MNNFGRGDEFIIILLLTLVFYKFTQFYPFLLLSTSLLSFWIWHLYDKKRYWQKQGVPCSSTNLFFGHMNELKSKGGGLPVTQNKKILENSLLRSMVSVLLGDDWRRVRNRITPAFTTGKLKRIIPTIAESSNQLINYISRKYVATNEEIPLKEIFGRFTLDVIGRSGFSSDFKTFTDEDSKIVKQTLVFTNPAKNIAYFSFMGYLYIQYFSNINIIAFFPVLNSLLERFFSYDLWDIPAQSFFHGIMSKLYDERKDDPEAKDKYNDIFQLLMNAVNDSEASEMDNITKEQANEIKNELITKQNDKYLSKIELFAQGLILLIAGLVLNRYDTTGSVLQFAIYMLALHPEAQAKLREEINDVLGIEDQITYEHLKSMEYLQAVVQETLRIYPPAPVSNRVCNTNLNINGINLREGDLVSVPIYSIQHNEEFYPEPEKFKPERFLREEKSSLDPITFLSFGLGPRNCIGMRFAEFQMQVVIALIMRRFNFKTSPNTPVIKSFKKILTNSIDSETTPGTRLNDAFTSKGKTCGFG
uniref:Cytochrome P450 n=2 Tax=Meloidogyne hapla TaxID=6305 RepID=A0A1I8BCE8_MELHA